MKKNLLTMSVVFASIFSAGNVIASDEVFTWSCSESKQFKTSGTIEKIRLTWESKTFDLDRQF